MIKRLILLHNFVIKCNIENATAVWIS